MGIARGLITLVLMLAFLALVAWLASSRNKHRFDAAARMPLEDDAGPEPLTPALSHKGRGS
jgi:cytochrome c oxidase cbb3-type subunit IV